MSEENVPKLRLKPKLVAEPVYVAPPPPVPSAEEFAPVPPAAPEEPKAVRLKPKLAAAPTPNLEPIAPIVPVEPAPNSPELSSFGSTFPPPLARPVALEPAQEIPKPEAKFSLKPKAAVAAFPPPFSPPSPVAPGPAQIPIPPPAYIGSEASQPIIAVPASPTAAPFPPPPGNFPPPPVAGGKPTPPWAQSDGSPKKKNFVLIAGGVVMVLLVLGGVFLAYRKFTAEPPPAPAKPSPVVTVPKSQPAVVQAPVEKPVQPAPAVENSAPADSVATTAATSPKPATAPEPEPVEVAPPPPPPSDAFKAWVDGIRVGGVRGGATTRVFIGGTAYAAGEMVNAQLGIIFDSYNAETRHLIFKDKTGAKVERRN